MEYYGTIPGGHESFLAAKDQSFLDPIYDLIARYSDI